MFHHHHHRPAWWWAIPFFIIFFMVWKIKMINYPNQNAKTENKRCKAMQWMNVIPKCKVNDDEEEEEKGKCSSFVCGGEWLFRVLLLLLFFCSVDHYSVFGVRFFVLVFFQLLMHHFGDGGFLCIIFFSGFRFFFCFRHLRFCCYSQVSKKKKTFQMNRFLSYFNISHFFCQKTYVCVDSLPIVLGCCCFCWNWILFSAFISQSRIGDLITQTQCLFVYLFVH